jgi:hypothetical protein
VDVSVRTLVLVAAIAAAAPLLVSLLGRGQPVRLDRARDRAGLHRPPPPSVAPGDRPRIRSWQTMSSPPHSRSPAPLRAGGRAVPGLLMTLHREVALMSWVGAGQGVAAGWLDAAVIAGHPMGYEDVATLPVLITEAGGRVTDLAGGDVLAGAGDVLTSNGHVHDQLLELVAGLPTGPRPHPQQFGGSAQHAAGPLSSATPWQPREAARGT